MGFADRFFSFLEQRAQGRPPRFNFVMPITPADREEARHAGATSREEEDTWLEKTAAQRCLEIGGYGDCRIEGDLMRVQAANLP